MAKKIARPLEKILLRLYEGDFTELQTYHPKLSSTEVIRTLVDNHLRTCRETANRNTDNDFATQLAASINLDDLSDGHDL